MADPISLGLLGGTFDPIHTGHLAMACTVQEQLKLDQILLLPAGTPWQRQPQATPQQRLQMARLAAQPYPFLRVDDREIQRAGPTFTVDTLRELRLQYGSGTGLYLILGTDAFLNLPSWHHWQELFTLCHLVILARGQTSLPLDQWPLPLQPHQFRVRRPGTPTQPEVGSNAPDSGDVQCRALWLRDRATPSGWIMELSTPLHPAASSNIRALLRQRQSTDQLLPKAVLDYIETHHLYQQSSDGTTTHQG